MPRVVVEVSNGVVWWILTNITELEVCCVNHDEGSVTKKVVQISDETVLDNYFELAQHMREDGLDKKWEEKARKLNPEFYLKMKKIQEKQKRKEVK